MREAQNLVTLTTSETPLKGGENTPLHPSSFEGIQPKKQAIQTPNSIMVCVPACPTPAVLGIRPPR